ncbi:MAG: c-type cytochrome [Candidatus Cyclobacteriaceae bacterium M3_2C_046]
MRLRHYIVSIIISLSLAGFLASCGAEGDNPGTEYAPNMYHSVPYDPYKQVTQETAGNWLNSRADNRGEYFNSNPFNPFDMNMRMPPANTVRRTETGMLPYRIPRDSLQLAARVVDSPLDSTAAVLEQGQALYNVYCMPCHGGSGQGDGAVGQVYLGVPAFNKGRYVTLTEGHIFHVITYGQGRMGAYGSQLDMVKRWQIVEYVQQLQQMN